MRRNDVASTSFRRRVPTRFLINQCQIITFLILQYDIIENSRIELRGIVLPVQVGGLLRGAKGYVAPPPPPSQIIGGAWPALAPLFLRLCKANYLVGWGWTLVCFLAYRSPLGGLLLLQYFSGVADALTQNVIA